MSIEKSNIKTPLYKLSEISGNRLYIKRKEIEESKANCVVTYGSGHSNHCRVVANMASAHGIPCYIIGPRLTGLAQINGQNYIKWEDRFELDVRYSERITFLGDMKIVLMTTKGLFGGTGVAEDTAEAEGNFAEIRKRERLWENGL